MELSPYTSSLYKTGRFSPKRGAKMEFRDLSLKKIDGYLAKNIYYKYL